MTASNCGACGNVRKTYQIDRHALTIVGLLETLTLAGDAAHNYQPHKQLAEWTARVVALLPADGRSDGEQWRPPERSAVIDDWARLGAFHGAIDGWGGQVSVSRRVDVTGAAQSAYIASYYAAFWPAARASGVLMNSSMTIGQVVA